MSNQPKKRWSPISIILAAIVVLVLYVLSFGPAAWICETFWPDGSYVPPFIDFIYAPMAWLSEKSELVHSFLVWYVSLWLP